MNRVRLLAATGAVLALAVTGCQRAADEDATPAVEASDTPTHATQRPSPLPPPTAGVVKVAGDTSASLTNVALRATGARGVETTRMSSGAAFDRLCSGTADVVDSSRPISAAELRSCADHGLDVVQLEVAADAAVVAIASETDVGGDCLTLAQVEELFRAGSPALSWSDVGLANVPLRVGGPGPGTGAFDYFSAAVLDAAEPSLVYFRSDYHAFSDDRRSRLFVTGPARDYRKVRTLETYTALLRSATAAVRSARENLRAAKDEYSIALAERHKGIVDQRPPADRARDQKRVEDVYAWVVDARARVADAVAARDRVAHRHGIAADALRDLERRHGNVAYFRFSYYELFEEQLRPFEITVDDDPQNCIFPSQQTVTEGQYPLARQLLLTTTTRSLARPEVRSFLEDYLHAARGLAVDARLVPLPRTTIDEQLSWVSGDVSPPVLKPPSEPSETPTTAGEPPA
ncbi:MAG TPA: substrate-binding domain-containing protein [Nocardioides sp.]|nr:substrate-binding domain-containing protein [Nocardioides sp.]